MNASEASRSPMIPMWAQVWGLRSLFVGGLGLLPTVLTGSPFPALAFVLSSALNFLFFVWFMRGALHLPRFLVAVHPMEPVLYRWLGVGLVKRIVATRAWPLMIGWAPPLKPKNREELLVRIEFSTLGSEVCHGAAFILVFVVTLLLLAVGSFREAVWFAPLNVLLNGYPVMLQRANRWRVQQIRASTRHEGLTSERVSAFEVIVQPPDTSLERTHGR